MQSSGRLASAPPVRRRVATQTSLPRRFSRSCRRSCARARARSSRRTRRTSRRPRLRTTRARAVRLGAGSRCSSLEFYAFRIRQVALSEAVIASFSYRAAPLLPGESSTLRVVAIFFTSSSAFPRPEVIADVDPHGFLSNRFWTENKSMARSPKIAMRRFLYPNILQLHVDFNNSESIHSGRYVERLGLGGKMASLLDGLQQLAALPDPLGNVLRRGEASDVFGESAFRGFHEGW